MKLSYSDTGSAPTATWTDLWGRGEEREHSSIISHPLSATPSHSTHRYCPAISIDDFNGHLHISLSSLAPLLKLTMLKSHIDIILYIT